MLVIKGTFLRGLDEIKKSLNDNKDISSYIQFLSCLSHSHILRVLLVPDFDRLRLAVEPFWMTLKDIIHQQEVYLDESERLDALMQLSSGLAFLHSLKVAHGHVTPENVVLRHVTDDHRGKHGLLLTTKLTCVPLSSVSVVYSAPELTSDSSTSLDIATAQMSDVYSVGLVAMETAVEVEPFEYCGVTHCQTDEQITKNNMPPFSNEALFSNLTEEFTATLEKCWRSEPLERPSAAHLELLLGQMTAIYRRNVT